MAAFLHCLSRKSHGTAFLVIGGAYSTISSTELQNYPKISLAELDQRRRGPAGPSALPANPPRVQSCSPQRRGVASLADRMPRPGGDIVRRR